MIQVAIIAPAPAIRAGLRTLLNPPEIGEAGGLEICYESATLAEFYHDKPPADVLVLAEDALSLPELQSTAEEYDGRLAVLLLTDTAETAVKLSAQPLRAWGALTLDASGEELQAALQALHEGLLVGAPVLMANSLSKGLTTGQEAYDSVFESLTERETEVLQRLALGLANKQIALDLGISEHTVKFHISSIYRKLGVTNRTEAVRIGFQRGLVTL